MIRKIAILLCSLASVSWAQDRYVISDSLFMILTNADIDSGYFLLPTAAIPATSHMTSDTTKAARRWAKPPGFSRVSGSFDLWLDRSNLSGTADSFRVYYLPVQPWTGRPARNDSTFLVGTATTFGNIVSGYRYTITVNPLFGIYLIVRQGDVAARTRVRQTLVYTQ